MARRGDGINAVDAFFRGFNQSYETVGRVLRDMDVAKVHRAQVEQGPDQIEVEDPNKTVTLPGIDGAPAETLQVGGELKRVPSATLLGEKVSPGDQDQIARVRQGKVADVLSKYNPAEGMRMRREMKADERADWQHGREKKRADREDAAHDKEQAYEKGRNELFANTRFGRSQVEYAKQLQAWKASGGQGEPPKRPAYTALDSIGDQAMLLDFDAQNGKLDAKAFGEFTQRLRTMQDEGYEKALRVAHAGAPLPQVLEAFNAAGQEKFGPEDVAKDERATGPDGVPTRRITMRDGTVIDTLSALDSLGKAGEVFSRYYKAKDDKRDDQRLGLAQSANARAQGEFNAAAPTRRFTQLLGETQATLLDPKASAEQRQAANARLADLGASKAAASGGSVPAEIQMARFVLASKMPGVTNEAQALEWVRRTKEKSPQAVRAELYKAAMQNGGDAATAQAEVDQAMTYLYPSAAAGAGVAGGDLLQQARDAVAKGADKAKVNERLAAQGLPPLP